MERSDFQPLLKGVDPELYINSKKDAVFDHKKFERTRFSEAASISAQKSLQQNTKQFSYHLLANSTSARLVS
tara:strand:- start:81 stop:296 length:216 start_codon:yes stop_codon:yes gene_type:complete